MYNNNYNWLHAFLADQRTKVMGILNVTPDSFSGDGLLQMGGYPELTAHRIHQFIDAGVDIIDVGGESTRPGASDVLADEEIQRVLPVIQTIRSISSTVLISVDTTKAEVARYALMHGANMINDVSGLMTDPEMVDVAREFYAPVVIMHSQQAQGVYMSDQQPSSANRNESIVEEVARDLERLVIYAISRGLSRQQIIVDPGIGFGKTVGQNYSLLKNLNRIKNLGYPVLLGTSRKSFIGSTTQQPVEERLPGSLVSAAIGVMKGANILRVHDVLETVQAVHIIDAIREVS